MTKDPSHLVQILLPKKTGRGQPISKDWFDGFLIELTEKFGGATSFLRAPGRGLWQSGGTTEKDSIAVVEVMTEHLDPAFWRSLRGNGWSGSFPRMRSSSGPRKSAGSSWRGMEELAIPRTFAAVTTVLTQRSWPQPLAVNLNPRVAVTGFIIFIVVSIAWMTRWLEVKRRS